MSKMGKNLYEKPRDQDKWHREMEGSHHTQEFSGPSKTDRLNQLKDRFKKQQKKHK